jgi:sigma-B regulation protein RsbU (phosphoserine phosphatase)
MLTANRARGLAILLGALLIALEIGHTRETWREWMQRASIPAAPGISFRNGFGVVASVTKEWEPYGIRPGDRIAQVNGREFQGEAFLRRAARRQAPGSEVVVTVLRPGEAAREVRLKLLPRTANIDWDDRVLAFFIEIFSRWSCLLLGLFVLLVRPRDILAWIVFGMLIGFARVAGTLPSHYADRWPAVIQGAAIFFDTLCSACWPASMMLFGILFPDPKSPVRLLGWMRWVLGPLLFGLGLCYASLNAAGALLALDLSSLIPLLRWSNYPMIGASFIGVSLFFMNIPYKAAKEKNPDARRRLRLFFWGANVTLVPVLILTVSRLVLGDLEKMPAWLLVGLLVLVTFFPVVVGYVLVVERAMDVRVVVRQGLRYALASRGVRMLQALLTAVVLTYAVEIASGQGAGRASRIATIAYAVLAIVLLGRFAGKLQQWIDRRFFREQARAEQMLLDLSQQVRGVIEPVRLRALVTDTVRGALHVERVELSLEGADGDDPGAELRLPLEAGAQRIGWLLLGRKRNEEPYSRNDIRLLENVAAQTALAMDNARLTSAVVQETAQRERIQREIEICREVQERIFPQRKPSVAGLDYVGLYRPAETVGGDCFEYMVDARGRLWLAIGDVAGKGVPAALLMAGVNAALRGLLAAGVSEVDQVFNHLNRVLYDSTPRNRFVTLLIVRYDPLDRRLFYASAGHCPMLLLRADGAPEWLTTRGIGLGLTGKASYVHAETRLEPGDRFVLYTDGVTEARNLHGEDFGEDRLCAAARGDTAHDLAARVIAEVERFAAGAPQHDDITVLAARCTA